MKSGEIKFLASDNNPHTIRISLYESGNLTNEIDIGYLRMEERKGNFPLIRMVDYQEIWNKEFKENFYKEKGLANCWYKDCSNKIYQKEGDYKAVNIQCQDKHKRYICLDCYWKGHEKQFNRKKEETIIKVIKCSFCKRESTGNHGKLFYCTDNKCAKKFWIKQK